jgi:subtilisin family serine protease
LLVRPIFAEQVESGQPPGATSGELATAILDCIRAGARVINLSLALTRSSTPGERALQETLDHAAGRGVLVVAAAGNQGTVGSSVITRHPWVIPVVAGDRGGRPLGQSNLGHSIGRFGLIGPGEEITSLDPTGPVLTSGGTSAAAPFVTGAIALLWSQYPIATAAQIKAALVRGQSPWRASVVPALLDAERAERYARTIQNPQPGGT